jgi:hypothetical protein
MHRCCRIVLLPVLVAVICQFACAARAATLDASEMKAALHTSTIEENGFIDRAVDLVDEGTLPEKMVVGTFLWARKKPKHKFQYFKRGLTLRASRIGVQL